ncbi:MAG: serine/threonine protein kinase [Deltaproteobacteria bacterium]|jgi:serine/threonine-protein kinase|nr:serine/threonine protein kinase [Deltaproteobacteria bacterium]
MADLPTQIGRYRVERLLGAGSMGNVYLAHDADLDRPVAVKTLRDLALDADTKAVFLSRFQNEAKAAARLHHPNIVQIFDVGNDPEVGPYLVFEYVEGHTLKEELKKQGPLPRERLLEVARQVGDALATAHVAGVIHRDLKPENLLITGNGQVKLADFGIARVPNADLTKEGQFLGTPCYSAPETLRKGEYSEQSDLFSFGAVMYEAASGERAFPGTEAMAVAHAVMDRSPVPPSEANRGASIPTAVDAAILRALEKNPGSRYASARTFVAALRQAYDGRRPRKAARKRTSLPFVMVVTLAIFGALWAAMEQCDRRKAGAGIDTGIAIGADAGAGLDAGDSDLSPHEREEAAKDELARARAALETGDVAAARAALDAAEGFDPSNPDIEELRTQVQAVELDGG